MLVPLLLSIASIGSVAGNNVIKISTPDEFIAFSNNTNSGTNYSGTTVLLDSDIDLTGKTFEPIGKDATSCFSGIFDGQGYKISNLVLSTDVMFLGLFGHSNKLGLKNIVIDSSCSFTSTAIFYGGDHCIGGIIGEYYADDEDLTIENSVNMAGITFDGRIHNNAYIFIGGIAGKASTNEYAVSTIKNCANYGTITLSGTGYNTYIGGFVGEAYGSFGGVYISNCLNSGRIVFSGSSTYTAYFGGLVGKAQKVSIENCIANGGYESTEYGYVGGLIGFASYYTTVKNCYWNKDLSSNVYSRIDSAQAYSYIQASEFATFGSDLVLNQTVSFDEYTGTSLAEAANAYPGYYALLDYSSWVLNKNEKDMTFKLNNGKTSLTLNSKVILLPNLAGNGRLSFDGWYTESACTTKFTQDEITENTELHGTYGESTKEYTISFDARGGSQVSPIKSQFGSVVTLPCSVQRESCKFVSWETDKGYVVSFNFSVPARDITLYAVWNCARITTANDLISFSKLVNSGANFSGTTVYLDADIDFTGKRFSPIGSDEANYFRGTFDGQGHTISNLAIKTTSFDYIGLFGYMEEPRVRNIILDASCSFESIHNGDDFIYLGGIIGKSYPKNKLGIVENVVSIASVTFGGNSDYDVCIGGLIGEISTYSASDYKVTVRNSANYGAVTHSGECRSLRIGGLIGDSNGPLGGLTHIQNALNFGAVTQRGTVTKNLYAGGLVGHSGDTVLENCVNIGSITTAKQSNQTGSIIGHINIYSAINNCYWSEDSGYDAYGTLYSTVSISNTAKFNSNLVLDKAVSFGDYQGTSLIEVLNAYPEYYLLRGLSKWIINKNGNDVAFKINGGKGFAVKSKVILLPDPITEGMQWFDSWYTDSAYTTKFTKNEVSAATELYGKFNENTNKYTISFDTDGGMEIKPITAQFGAVVPLPDGPVRGDCTIKYWETLYGDEVSWNFTVPAHDVTLYPVRYCTHISTPREFIDFARYVNYMKTIQIYFSVYLDSDIEFTDELSKRFMQVGSDEDINFDGTFDGQGHVISNLKFESTSTYTGLFGSGERAVIMNLILDGSCSITSSSRSSGDAYIGGIIGYHTGGFAAGCSIENCVNLASVSFNGEGENVYLGGIAGYVNSKSGVSTVKNCANYGSVSFTGTGETAYVGGITGTVTYQSYKPKYTHTYNCLNDGPITFNGESSTLYMGGIVGLGGYNLINNSVSSGTITTTSSGSVGNIAGRFSAGQDIKHCFWTVNNDYGAAGYGTVSDPDTSYSAPSTELIGKLNTYSKANSWNGWLLNKNGKDVTFKINRGKGYTVKSQVVLIHDLVNNDRVFSGWYKDAALTEAFAGSEVESDITLHGTWIFTIVFDFWNGTEITKIVGCGEAIPYPENTEREGYTFIGWFASLIDKNPYGKTEAVEDITLYARYKEKQSGGGSESGSGSEGSKGEYDSNSKSGSSIVKASPLFALILAALLVL